MKMDVANAIAAVKAFNKLVLPVDIHMLKSGEKFIIVRSTTHYDAVHISKASFLGRATELIAQRQQEIDNLREYIDKLQNPPEDEKEG